jgi:leader peptidase (prepilin peptidase)/N-methyltransferase
VVIGLFFLFGIVIGSFLNVCISRIPEGLSVVAPASRCPRCLKPIKPYDNVPVFGWIWLGGKCRNCKLPISVMYPLVELLTGLLFIACYLTFDLSLATAKWVVFCCLIVVLSITDLRVRILPDVVNWPGSVIGLIFAWFVPLHDGSALWLTSKLDLVVPSDNFLSVVDSLLGAITWSLVLWLIATLFKAATGREGMGFGDVKMMVMVGTFLGVRGAFLTILLGTLLGSILGVSLIVILYLVGWNKKVAIRGNRMGLGKINALRWAIAKRYQLPLGTFLGIGALAVVFFGSMLWQHWPG